MKKVLTALIIWYGCGTAISLYAHDREDFDPSTDSSAMSMSKDRGHRHVAPSYLHSSTNRLHGHRNGIAAPHSIDGAQRATGKYGVTPVRRQAHPRVHHHRGKHHPIQVAGVHHPKNIAVLHYKQGEVRQGYVVNVYDTADKKSAITGFKQVVPPQFQKPTWVQLYYDNGANRTIAMVPKGMQVRKGDLIRISFGKRHPPIPNKVVQVIHKQKASIRYPSRQPHINRY